MRLEFEPNSSAAATFVEKDALVQDVSAEFERMFREGVRAAQEGKRADARALLLRVTEADTDNENAWLWLASISEYPEELLVFLNNVLRINPHNERALEWNKATKSLLAKTLVQRGLEAVSGDRADLARQCFEQAVEHDAENETAWLWMASVVDAEEEKVECFERVLGLNPASETALEALRAIQSQKTRQMFQDALAAAFEGRHENALEMLDAVLSRDAEMEDAWVLKSHLAPSFEERAECFLQLRAVNPENEMAKANLASWRALSEKLARPAKEEETAPAEVAELSDAPTQDLNPEPHFQPASLTSFNLPETGPETAFAGETAAPETSFEEAATEEVRFEAEEQGEPADEETTVYLEAALEAEEAEMNRAFTNPSPEKREAADYFQSEESDDIHKTQQANYEPADFAPDFENQTEGAATFAAPTGEATVVAGAETPEETLQETPGEEWRDASPAVFVDYSPAAPENSFEAPTVQFVYPEAAAQDEFSPAAPVAEQTETSATVDFGPEFEAVEVEETAAEQFSMTEEQFSAPEEQFAVTAETVSEETPAEKTEQPKSETVLCPFCDAENEKQAFACGACQTILTLSDLEMLLGQQTADAATLQRAVESLERENESFGLGSDRMMNLGVAHVNLKNYRQGFLYLQEAVRLNPSNVLLDAQVNALAIRLSEMEEQQNAHDLLSKNRKILVVDDSPTVRKLISGKLEKCGHEVVCAIDGVDALEKIRELKPDLVLLDITMPRMDGYQVCKMIRSNESTKDVPVVMISGKDGFFDKVRGRMAGTSGYITKPFGPETLMKTVETYLN